MNKDLREKASSMSLSLMDYILQRLEELEKETQIRRTIFAVCPNSSTVIRAALKSAKRCNAPAKFAATLNQVYTENSYTGMNHKEFITAILEYSRVLNVTVPVVVAIDHGGPWLKDLHAREKWSYTETMNTVMKSFEEAIKAGFDLIHVDPTVDITLDKNQTISIDVVADRTIELIEHTEKFRRSNGFPRISYEVGTEEVHGGLADLEVFERFLFLLKEGLTAKGLADVWPCFIVGKVGTDLHTTTFDPYTAQQISGIARKYGSLIKCHYSDNVSNPEAYPESGMGAANVGPEFTECEYEGLMELEKLEKQLFSVNKTAKVSDMEETLKEAVINSGRWKKWLNDREDPDDFDSISSERQLWLIKTGCRYIWENAEVISARTKLYKNLEMHGIEASFIVETKIEKALDKYFHAFNLVDLNNLL